MAGTASRTLLQAQRGELLATILERTAGTQRARGRRRGEMLSPAVLDGGERLRIINTTRTVLQGAYCHLPQKRAAYALNPVQALSLLERRATELSDAEFHLAMTSIVTGLRDAHTRYSGPRSTQNAVAVLPFLVEQYGPYDGPTFIVSKIANSRLLDDEQFVPNVKLETWNGVPMVRAVEIHADRETGGRPDARRVRALESLTFRDSSTVRRPTNCGSMSATAPRAARGASCECRGASCDLTRPRPDTAPALAARVSSPRIRRENASAAPRS